jgi:hypothetical protein
VVNRKVSDLSGKPIEEADHVRIDARFGDGRRGMTCDLTVAEFTKLLPFARPLRPYGPRSER